MNRNKRYLYIGLLALAAILFCLWPRGRPVAQSHDSNSTTAENDGKQAPSWTGRLPAPRSLKKPDDVSEEDWNTFLRNRAIAEASNQRVLFYGKVLDQNGDPVVDATVRATSTARAGVAEALASGKGQKHKELAATTDAKGCFNLDGGRGFGLHIQKISKEGYVLKPYSASQFIYGQLLRDPSSSRFHHPDPTKPVVFHMWKLSELENIKSYYGAALRMEVDTNRDILNHPYVDLIEGKIHNDARSEWDLMLERLDDNEAEWRIRLIANKGGFHEAMNDSFLFEAPTDGYSNVLEISAEDSRAWPGGKWSGYVKLREGSAFGAIRFSVIVHPSGTCRVAISDARVNPHGSRNLQYDGSNRIKQGFR